MALTLLNLLINDIEQPLNILRLTMQMTEFEKYFENSLDKTETIIQAIAADITNQEQFDALFHFISDAKAERVRFTIAAIEFITRTHPGYLKPYIITELLWFSESEYDWEVRMYLALILPRLKLSRTDCVSIFVKLSNWVFDKNECEPVRINGLKGVHEMAGKYKKFKQAFHLLTLKLNRENNPLLNTTIRELLQPQ